MNDNFTKIVVGLATLLVLALWSAVSNMDMEDEEAANDLYCSMVALNKSQPDKGWPDYKGIYQTACPRTPVK